MGERHAAALDADEQQTLGAGLLLDDLVGQADRRSADLVRGHDLTAAHRSFPASLGLPGGLTGPWLKGQAKDTAPRSGPVSRRRRSPGSCPDQDGQPQIREEVRPVEVHDPALLLRPVVVDDARSMQPPLPQILTTRPARQAHGGRAVVVEGRRRRSASTSAPRGPSRTERRERALLTDEPRPALRDARPGDGHGAAAPSRSMMAVSRRRPARPTRRRRRAARSKPSIAICPLGP